MNYRPRLAMPVALLLAVAATAATAQRPIQLRDFRALQRTHAPSFSPDGKNIAYLTGRSDFAADGYDVTLNVLDVVTGRSRVLVRGMRGLDSPRWSSDGRTIAFIASAARRPSQIYTVPLAGGTPTQLGNAPNGVEQFSWSPDGASMAFVTPDDSPMSTADRNSHRDLFAIHDDDYLIDEPPVPSHIWVLPVHGGHARQLTHGTTSVLEAPPPFGGGVSAPAWSADGQWIAYTQQADPDDADTDQTRVMAVNVATGRERPMTANHTYEYAPRFSPKSDTVAWLYPKGPGPISDMEVFVGSPDGGAARDVSADLDRDLGSDFAWLPDGSGVVAIANNGIASTLYTQPLHGPGHALDLGGLNALEVAVSPQGALAVVAEGATHAPELYLMATQSSHPKRLTDINRSFDAYAYPRNERVQWTAPDGQANDGILTYPNGYHAGKQYPLVVFSHGGPEAAATEGFDNGEIGPLRDLFAADGYLVFEPNYRGSDNLGSAHEHAIFRDPGNGPAADVISGIQMLEKRGIVDASRIAAVGHSYGGYVTAWLIGHQHFWKCAVVADGVTDWTEEYELSGDGNMAWTSGSLGGSPWDSTSAELYRTGSPITYAAAITTPTLILSGTADITVPITESFALYHALASRHVPVQFMGIPGAHHSPQDPVHRELYYQTIERWVAQYQGR